IFDAIHATAQAADGQDTILVVYDSLNKLRDCETDCIAGCTFALYDFVGGILHLLKCVIPPSRVDGTGLGTTIQHGRSRDVETAPDRNFAIAMFSNNISMYTARVQLQLLRQVITEARGIKHSSRAHD